MDPTTVYTDGACQGNPGPGGWAWAVPGGPFRSGSEAHTTNQRMELQAVLDAVSTLAGTVEVVSDSTYVVNCFKNRWWEGWERRGWKSSQRQDVANQDLWRPLIDAYKADPGRLAFRWVKGHSADPMNDLVDRLAVEAAARQVGRSGTGTPDGLGPPDRPAAAGRPGVLRSTGPGPATLAGGGAVADPAGEGARPPDGPAGHRLVVTGLRPPGLGGWDDNLVASAVRRRLAEILGAKAALHPDLVVTTGLGLGAEQLGAEAAADAGVAYVAVLAFPEQDRVWPGPSRARFALLLAGAKEALVMDTRTPADRQAAGRSLSRRDTWLDAHADEAVVVWDGADADVGTRVRALQRRLGEEQVWILEP